MKNGDYESLLWKLLEKEQLADLSQFHKPHFYDEVPLYSRNADIAFLSDCTNAKANAILLGFSLKFLNSVIAYEEHPAAFFAAITIRNGSPADRIVPNLFVWSGSISRLKDKLTLETATSAFGRKIERQLSKLHLLDHFGVREESANVPDLARVFIAPLHAPYPNFVAKTKVDGT